MYERTAQILACWFDISTDDEAMARALDDLLPNAIQQYPLTHRHRLEARCDPRGYRIFENGVECGVAEGHDAVLLVATRLHELAHKALADYTKLHAACATLHSRRFLVVGDKGAGKSTLVARLLFDDGFSVEGDELVLLRNGQCVAYPRRFGIRRKTLRLLPPIGALKPEHRDLPIAEEVGGFQVLGLDPTQLGLKWRITPGPVDALFFLLPRHTGPTTVTPCGAGAMAHRLMARSVAPVGGHGQWVRDVSAAVRDASTFDLTVGDLDSAAAAVRQSLVDIPLSRRTDG